MFKMKSLHVRDTEIDDLQNSLMALYLFLISM